MYRSTRPQMTLYDYIPPFDGKLCPQNRWVQLAARVDWDALEQEYSGHFRQGGKAAISARAAFGSLVVHDALHISDAETVQQIRENPYLQYFLGQTSFDYASPVSVRSMARFRRRIAPTQVAEAVALFEQLQKPRPQEKKKAE